MKTIDTDLIEAFLNSYPYYASVTYEIDKLPRGGVGYEYSVYRMDGLGEGWNVRFDSIEELEKWLIENTRSL